MLLWQEEAQIIFYDLEVKEGTGNSKNMVVQRHMME